ncbi:roadblock/LC7 domain-containing protein [Streptomyces ipomoeae]|jgi:predicted regulator of Ras-like GTPase activity (Roadblock/LC7/MglB family)|uniref:Roadblock/LC7 domain protein n=2 Tax=Streptomyces ipomoeae TaxID=103232 RepID=L1KK01_9ACTN|nr:roadblock/LC7 domain-containing protein [Streptomyces ipomoeae]EKX60927.1 roadblock/LC7 domain protein [Streptomyces ipomoeae 91-03]MDX2698790.1 roadblock/LC7 domain-containing protein [Streptomyces ipomoeae]MDX2823785.1 roadblock/LC7 domain-containing protein [Streptomyces ipomoeae]MDX2840216.1 roadblock/LC7 domain-containing protein [Streptomyces ipomoeae]MDX2880325.1 roadblock/LC7 domain-containing protein [Streptomyces ipomoeae]
MNNDLSWMLDSALEIPGALHAVLVSADGLLRARSKDVGKDDADKAAAAMSGMQSLSRSLAFFVDGSNLRWQQTLIEFDGGWIFLISAGDGAYLAVSASPDVDMADITFRMQQLVGQLGKVLTAPPRESSVVRP